MTDKNTGGPAFPQPAVISDTGDILTSLNFDEGGMTLRDYFAAKAMQGLISQSLGTALGSEPKIGAIYAYAMADEMIKERSK